MRHKNVRKRAAKFTSAMNVQKRISAENRQTATYILILLFIIIISAVYNVANSATFECNAYKYKAEIQAVNNFVDYEYNEAGTHFIWHIELIDSPSFINDYLIIKNEKYSITYPAYCKKIK